MHRHKNIFLIRILKRNSFSKYVLNLFYLHFVLIKLNANLIFVLWRHHFSSINRIYEWEFVCDSLFILVRMRICELADVQNAFATRPAVDPTWTGEMHPSDPTFPQLYEHQEQAQLQSSSCFILSYSISL